MSPFFNELKRRNVYKVAVAYAVVGWLLVQIATQTFPFFDIPNWAVRLVILLVGPAAERSTVSGVSGRKTVTQKKGTKRQDGATTRK